MLRLKACAISAAIFMSTYPAKASCEGLFEGNRPLSLNCLSQVALTLMRHQKAYAVISDQDGGIYVQIAKDNDLFFAEAVSDKFFSNLRLSTVKALLAAGWRSPDAENDNFTYPLSSAEVSRRRVAPLLVQALLDYGKKEGELMYFSVFNN